MTGKPYFSTITKRLWALPKGSDTVSQQIIQIGGRRPLRRHSNGPTIGRNRSQLQSDQAGGPLTVLIIDDQAVARMLLEQVLLNIDPGLEIKQFATSMGALEWLEHGHADLMFVDFELPQMDGVEYIRRVRQMPRFVNIPIVTITAHTDRVTRLRALKAGATEFIGKPLDIEECALRCRTQLHFRRQQRALEHDTWALAERVRQATIEVRDRERETLMRLARAGEYRDEETGNHVVRMARYSALIAGSLGMGADEVDMVERAAPLHDIGKIGIPDHILLKPGKFLPEEWETMKTHAAIGHEILKGSQSKFMRMGAEIAFCHHEKWDGTGYPQGLSGEAIPLVGRIVCIADVYDALTSQRPYKSPWPSEKAFAYLAENAGVHFDPAIVSRFESMRSKIIDIQLQYAN